MKQEARPIPYHLQNSQEKDKLILSGHLGKFKKVEEDSFVNPVLRTVKKKQISWDSIEIMEIE